MTAAVDGAASDAVAADVVGDPAAAVGMGSAAGACTGTGDVSRDKVGFAVAGDGLSVAAELSSSTGSGMRVDSKSAKSKGVVAGVSATGATGGVSSGGDSVGPCVAATRATSAAMALELLVGEADATGGGALAANGGEGAGRAGGTAGAADFDTGLTGACVLRAGVGGFEPAAVRGVEVDVAVELLGRAEGMLDDARAVVCVEPDAVGAALVLGAVAAGCEGNAAEARAELDADVAADEPALGAAAVFRGAAGVGFADEDVCVGEGACSGAAAASSGSNSWSKPRRSSD